MLMMLMVNNAMGIGGQREGADNMSRNDHHQEQPAKQGGQSENALVQALMMIYTYIIGAVCHKSYLLFPPRWMDFIAMIFNTFLHTKM